MNRARDVYSAAIAIEMRAPLARVELAASELMRGAATPVARDLSAGIREAVADLDRLISKLLSFWVPPATRDEPVDIANVLHSLHERLSPVMSARGIIFELSISSSSTVLGSADIAHEVGVALLRAGAALVGSGGRLDLMAESGLDRYGIRLTTRPRTSRKSAALSRMSEIIDELSGSIMRLGASVEVESSDGEVGSICVWVPDLIRGVATVPSKGQNSEAECSAS